MNQKTLIWPITLLIAALLSGCVSQNAASTRIKAFSDATTLVTSNMKAGLDTTENKYFDVQVQRAVVDYDKNGFQPGQFKPLFTPESRSIRNAVLDSFSLYGQNLSAMMGNEQLDQFDAATKAFGTKLTALSQTITNTKLFTTKSRPLSDSEVAIVTTAIEGVGTLFIEWKRGKSVREAVTAMDTNVEVICEALTNDLKVLRQMVANEYQEGQIAEDQFIRHNNLDPVTKRAEIRALAQSVVDQRNADATFAAMEQSVVNWRAAHKQLLQVFEKDKTQIDALVQQLIADGTRIKAFYDSLQKQ